MNFLHIDLSFSSKEYGLSKVLKGGIRIAAKTFIKAGLSIILIGFFYSEKSFSSPDELPRETEVVLLPYRFDPAELYFRAQAVLQSKFFQVPQEPDSQPYMQNLSGKQTVNNLISILPYVDPTKTFLQLFALSGEPTSPQLVVYQDFQSRKVFDYKVNLSPNNQQSNIHGLFKSFTPTVNHPLNGLRVALDPGHMGGAEWDKLTGKYVTNHRGNTLSEGLLNLQVALLLEKELMALGAQVLITHRNLGPVTTLNWKDLDLHAYGLEKLRDSSLENWFQNLLMSIPSGVPPNNQLFEAFTTSQDVKKMFSEFERGTYYVQGADLQARVDDFEKFQADIAISIHFDSSNPINDPNGLNPHHFSRTKAYVLGGFAAGELSSREARRNLGLHILNESYWQNSVNLAHALVASIGQELGLKPDSGHDPLNINVGDGVIARNLFLTRKTEVHTAMTLVECLYYNDSTEFNSLLHHDQTINIDGKNYFYSNRLTQVVQALRDGISTFAKGLPAMTIGLLKP